MKAQVVYITRRNTKYTCGIILIVLAMPMPVAGGSFNTVPAAVTAGYQTFDLVVFDTK